MDGKPLYLLPFMRQIINSNQEKTMLFTGRQVGKSTLTSAIAVTELTSHPYWRSLYVAPRQDQITAYATDKLGPMLMNSPLIKKYYIDSSCKQQVFLRELTNNSCIYLRSCYLNADGIRGLSINSVYIDEVN